MHLVHPQSTRVKAGASRAADADARNELPFDLNTALVEWSKLLECAFRQADVISLAVLALVQHDRSRRLALVCEQKVSEEEPAALITHDRKLTVDLDGVFALQGCSSRVSAELRCWKSDSELGVGDWHAACAVLAVVFDVGG